MYDNDSIEVIYQPLQLFNLVFSCCRWVSLADVRTPNIFKQLRSHYTTVGHVNNDNTIVIMDNPYLDREEEIWGILMVIKSDSRAPTFR